MKIHVPVLLGSILIAGCSKTPTSDWLAGSWTFESSSCDSGDGVIFGEEGNWAEEEREGRWSLDGNTITVKVTGTYDEQGNLVPDENEEQFIVTRFDQNSFTSTGKDGRNPVTLKRCSGSQPESPTPTVTESSSTNGGGRGLFQKEQKIIWQFTGGYNIQDQYAAYTVPQQCKKLDENLNGHMSDGWRIASSTPALRNVRSGICQGRDIILER